jgi:hypothetical protein
MRLIPIPEFVLVLVIALVLYGLRMLRRFTRAAAPPHSGGVTRPFDEGAGLQRKRAQLIAACVVMAMISLPLMLKVVPPNGAYGFRTSLTQSSPEIWYPANAFMGWALFVAAVVSAIVLITLPGTARRWLLWAAYLGPIVAAIVASFVYLNRFS